MSGQFLVSPIPIIHTHSPHLFFTLQMIYVTNVQPKLPRQKIHFFHPKSKKYPSTILLFKLLPWKLPDVHLVSLHPPPPPPPSLSPPSIFLSPTSPVNYTLKNPSGVIGRISFFKPSYKVGEDVTGALDLTLATTSCIQVSVEIMYSTLKQNMHSLPLSCSRYLQNYKALKRYQLIS